MEGWLGILTAAIVLATALVTYFQLSTRSQIQQIHVLTNRNFLRMEEANAELTSKVERLMKKLTMQEGVKAGRAEAEAEDAARTEVESKSKENEEARSNDSTDELVEATDELKTATVDLTQATDVLTDDRRKK